MTKEQGNKVSPIGARTSCAYWAPVVTLLLASLSLGCGCIRELHVHLHEDIYEQQVEVDEDAR